MYNSTECFIIGHSIGHLFILPSQQNKFKVWFLIGKKIL